MADYTVSTKNRFQLSMLDNSDDEDIDLYEVLKQEEAKKEEKRKALPLSGTTKSNNNDVAPKKSVKEPKKDSKTRNEKAAKATGKSALKASADELNNANVMKTKKVQLGSSTVFEDNKKGSNSSGSGRNENRPHRMRQSTARRAVDQFEKPPQDQDTQFGVFGGEFKRGGRYGGGSGRSRGGAGGFRGNRRSDRHSGSDRTGVKATEKREGFGSHNWGAEIESQLEQCSVAESSGAANADAAPKSPTGGDDDGTTPADESQTTADSEKNTETESPADTTPQMTLDEWKASQVGSRTRQAFNVRRAGEGEDPTQWQQTVAIESRNRIRSESATAAEAGSDEDEEEVGNSPSKVEDTRSALNKLNIEIKFSEPSRSGSSRGGGGRGGSGRGGRFGGGARGDRTPRDGDRSDRFGSAGSRGDRPFRGGGRGRARGANRDGSRSAGFGRFSSTESPAPRVDNEREFPSLRS